MKKIITLLLSLVLVAGVFSGCSGGKADSAKYSVVCTVFSEYEWTREIAAGDDDTEVKLLGGKGVDLHNYQPTIKDVAEISRCDMFVYVGGISDGWTKNVLSSAENKNMRTIKLFDVLSSRLREEDEEDDNEHDHDHDHDHDETEYDEHLWLSLKNAVIAAEKIKDELTAMNPDKSDLYASNFAAYKQKLDALDGEYAAAVSSAKVKTLVFADRFPFRYMTEDYGIEYFAAFPGCSSQSEISPAKIMSLASKIDEKKLNCVVILSDSKEDVAKAVIEKTAGKNQKIVKLDSLQSVSTKDIQNGKTYLSAMQSNLAALKTALEAE